MMLYHMKEDASVHLLRMVQDRQGAFGRAAPHEGAKCESVGNCR